MLSTVSTPNTTGTAFEKCSHMQNKPSQVKSRTTGPSEWMTPFARVERLR